MHAGKAVTCSGGEPPVDPVAVARAVHAQLGIAAPHEIAIELIAFELGAHVHWRDAGPADARTWIADGRATIAIDAWQRGMPRARFSIAHELAHLLLHRDHDAIARLHGAIASRGEHVWERQANVFASELLVPTSLAAPRCAGELPTLDAVASLARAFDVSLSVAARRWAQLSTRACAMVESRGERSVRVIRSEAFGGVAVQGRVLGEGTLARAMARGDAGAGARVHVGAEGYWGSVLVGRIVEECVPLGGGKVLTWLWHE